MAAAPIFGKTDDARKAAVLEWAAADANAEEAEGRAIFARMVRADIEVAKAVPLGALAQTPRDLFPPIPKTETNPYFNRAVKAAKAIAAAPSVYVKGPAGNIVHSDAEGWHFIRVCDDARHLVYALCHPQSPLSGDASLVAPILRRFSHVYEYQTPGSKNLADFGISPTLAEMYLLLRTAYPDLILPAYRAAWEKAIETNSQAIVAKYGTVFREAKPGTGYPNAHTHYLVALLCASRILERPEYRDIAESGVKLMATCLYPDGGTCYIGTQNECFTYHEIAVRDMTRYWQLNGNETARSIAVGTRWYYPLSIEPSGVVEYSSAPSWKPYWNMSTGAEGAAVVASLTGCPHNLRVARSGKIDGNFWIAGMYRDDIEPAAAPDGYITHDRNIEGPRGRFGGFSFCGTSRDYHDDPRGKITYAGCMAMDPHLAGAAWPLSAALYAVGPEVRIKPGPGDVSRWSTHLCLARAERNRATVTKDFAAVTTANQLSVYNGAATDWAATQQWVFTPKRLVGMVSLEALSDRKALAMGGSLQFVSGRGGWGVRKEFIQKGPGEYQYGALIVKIHVNSFGNVATEYTDVFSGGTRKSGRIVLTDAEGGKNDQVKEILYARGTRASFLFEVYPEWNKPAEGVRRMVNQEGLEGFELREAGSTLQVIHNPADAPRGYDARSPFYSAGAQYRAPWLSTGALGTGALDPGATKPQSSAAAQVSIGPDSHIVVIA